MSIAVTVKTHLAVIEYMPKCTYGCTPLHGAPGVHLDPPPGQVVRGGQALGASPDGPGHHAPRHPVDHGLPGDVSLLLGQEGQHGPLEGDLLCLLLGLLLILVPV